MKAQEEPKVIDCRHVYLKLAEFNYLKYNNMLYNVCVLYAQKWRFTNAKHDTIMLIYADLGYFNIFLQKCLYFFHKVHTVGLIQNSPFVEELLAPPTYRQDLLRRKL